MKFSTEDECRLVVDALRVAAEQRRTTHIPEVYDAVAGVLDSMADQLEEAPAGPGASHASWRISVVYQVREILEVHPGATIRDVQAILGAKGITDAHGGKLGLQVVGYRPMG